MTKSIERSYEENVAPPGAIALTSEMISKISTFYQEFLRKPCFLKFFTQDRVPHLIEYNAEGGMVVIDIDAKDVRKITTEDPSTYEDIFIQKSIWEEWENYIDSLGTNETLA